MLIFAAGTLPLMLVFGATAALLPRKFLPAMTRASAVLVMFLGVVTFARAAALAGIALPEIGSPRASATPLAATAPASPSYEALEVATRSPSGQVKATVAGGVQTIVTEIDANNYQDFAIQAGLPLKWTVRVSAANLNGCNNTILVPAYGIKKPLKVGDNLIEFTPKAEGPIAYSCWMGMIRNRITVVKDLGQVATIPGAVGLGASGLAAALAEGNGALPAAGSCCSTAGTNTAFAGGRVPVDTLGFPVMEKGIQVITVTVSSAGYSPAAFVLEKGSKAIVRFKAEGLSSCNNPVVFPEYNGSLDLSRGQLETPAIPVTGDFTFSCWMGMLHGYIKVVDDLKKVDLAKVRAEIGAWRAPAGSACCGGASVQAGSSPKGN